MTRFLSSLCCTVVLLSGAVSGARAENWQLLYLQGELSAGASKQVRFEFGNNVLRLVGKSYSNLDPTSVHSFNPVDDFVFLNGTWAVCGIVSNGQLIPDPYATFVQTTPGNGYVSWRANTPANYVAPLMLGALFDGCGAQFPDTDEAYPEVEHEATILVYAHSHSAVSMMIPYWFDPGMHTFYTTQSGAVPEPASMLTLLTGIGGLAGFAVRRRR